VGSVVSVYFHPVTVIRRKFQIPYLVIVGLKYMDH